MARFYPGSLVKGNKGRLRSDAAYEDAWLSMCVVSERGGSISIPFRRRIFRDRKSDDYRFQNSMRQLARKRGWRLRTDHDEQRRYFWLEKKEQ